jgi:hypothetical protein
MPDDQSPTEITSHFDSLDASDLPEEIDEAAVERISTVAYLLDECITVPGTDISVGLDPLVGVVPVVGDAISTSISLYIVAESAYLGVSLGTVVRMLGNVAIDTVGGSIPYAGPVFDAIWKTNVRNLDLLLDDLAIEPESTDGHDGHDGHDDYDGHDGHDDHDDGPIRIDVEDA